MIRPGPGLLGHDITADGSGEPREAMEPPVVPVSSTGIIVANKRRKSTENGRSALQAPPVRNMILEPPGGEKGETMKPKFVAEVIKRDGKHFVSVPTPLGTDIEHPATFDPDIHHEAGPFESEEDANARLIQVEDTPCVCEVNCGGKIRTFRTPR